LPAPPTVGPMTTRAQNRHTRQLEFRRGPIVAILVLGATVVTTLATVASAASPAGRGQQTAAGFGWPVKPFHRPHPLRSHFGDPRTRFDAPPTMRGLMTSGGSFAFHQGIDIYAPNGAPVYPVVPGVVSHVDDHKVVVTTDEGARFEFWHIKPRVVLGTRVDAYRTVLGRIARPFEHVHLTVVEHGHVVNPLVRGRLTPYRDTTRPSVEAITFRRGQHELFGNFLSGRVSIVAEARDLPELHIPGIWRDLAVTPALITWRIQKWTGNVVERGVARDVRSTVPENAAFWSTYARGTFQNMAVFGNHYSRLQGGRYLFKLTPLPFNTRRLEDGVYELVVTAKDMRGNSGSLARRFTVHNRDGWR
jgi:hypothetical protein